MGDIPKRLAFDLEIARPIPSGKGGRLDWSRAIECGVSVCGTWLVDGLAPAVYFLDPTRLPDGHDASRLRAEFNSVDGFVSWNGADFDTRMLETAVPGITVSITNKKHVDLMAMCAALASGVPAEEMLNGIPMDWKERWGANFRGWSLGAVCESTLGIGKSGHGADAPNEWQLGFYSKVSTYCIHDVALTRMLWRFAWMKGYLIGPSRVEIPQALL